MRNEEGSFFVCQAVQNVYKGSKKIKVRWMTANGRVYTPDFYDTIGEWLAERGPRSTVPARGCVSSVCVPSV